jgi:hypothetical protein
MGKGRKIMSMKSSARLTSLPKQTPKAKVEGRNLIRLHHASNK